MNIAYVAGFLDGEGCIYINDSTLYVITAQCNKEVLDKCKESFGGGVYEHISEQKRQKTNWRRSWQWRVWNKGAADLLEACLPYLIVKKEEAELALKFWKAEDRLEKRADYKKQLQDIRKAA